MEHAGLIVRLRCRTPAVLFAVVLGSMLHAKDTVKSCPGVEVLSINSSAVTPDPKSVSPAEIVVSPASTGAENPRTVTVIGPVLGSMDSANIQTELACTPAGIKVTGTLMRSSSYSGGALKNVLWRPKLTLIVALRNAEIVFESVWAMQLSTGALLDHAQTPSQPDQRYPIIVTKKISLRS